MNCHPKPRPLAANVLACVFSLTLLGLSACNRSQPTVTDSQSAQVASSATSDHIYPDSDLKSDRVADDAADGVVNRDAPIKADSDDRESDMASNHAQSGSREPHAADSSEAQAAEIFFSGNWTTRRLIALAPGGPSIIDLSVTLDDQSLNEASDAVTAELAAEILEGLETPVQWNDLLEQPLVKSGWLGNLIAAEDQTSQLIGMYDSRRDGVVSQDELGAFLSRGLARNAPMQISDVGQAPGSDVSLSPWGVADSNQDYALDAQEIEGFSASVDQFDYNGDAIITAQELNQGNPSSADASMSQMSLLETNTLVFTEADHRANLDQSTLDQSTLEQLGLESRRVSSTVLGHYTFLEGVPRDEWSNWSAARWNELDSNEDGLLVRAELEHLLTISPDQQLYIRFPELAHHQGQFSIRAAEDKSADSTSVAGDAASRNSMSSAASSATWVATGDGGRIALNGCIVEVRVTDVFGGQGPKLLRDRLEGALKDPQLQAFFKSQLQLQDGAFELLDPDGDKSLSDEEFAAAWRWLSARQGTRLLVRWMTATTPWFQLLDTDGNRRLTAVELQRAAQSLGALDTSGDASLTPNELPLTVVLEVKRDDTRLGTAPFGMSGQSDEDSADEDWFSAMDTNRDGYIANAEFLGDLDDFGNLDADKDGFISRNEVYEGLASY